MNEIIYYNDENIYLSNKWVKFNSKTYSLDIIQGTIIRFYPFSKARLWLLLLLGILEIGLYIVSNWDGYYLLIGLCTIGFAIYYIVLKNYTLQIVTTGNKNFSTIVSKDLKYLEKIDSAFQLAFDEYVTPNNVKNENN